MKGIEITVTNTKLQLKEEQRKVKLFVIFKDLKYGTKYILFADNINKELFYGYPVINEEKMVIMKFKEQKHEELIKEFLWDHLNNINKSNYELIEVPKMNKIEIIDNNILNIKEEYIEKLNDIYFKKEELEEQQEHKKIKKGPIIFTIFIILIIVLGVLYLKNNKELLKRPDKYLQCKTIYNIDEIQVNVEEIINLTFVSSNNIKQHKKEIIYKFNDNDKYYEFKEKDLSYKYTNLEGKEQYNDEELTYKLIVEYNINNNELPKTYDEIYKYYQNNNYSCNDIEK